MISGSLCTICVFVVTARFYSQICSRQPLQFPECPRREFLGALDLLLLGSGAADADADDRVAFEDVERAGDAVAAPDGGVADAAHIARSAFVLFRWFHGDGTIAILVIVVPCFARICEMAVPERGGLAAHQVDADGACER